jgi:hypothetical protein
MRWPNKPAPINVKILHFNQMVNCSNAAPAIQAKCAKPCRAIEIAF